MRQNSDEPETLFHPKETADDMAPLVGLGGFAHLKAAIDEDAELEFESGEDADGDPNDPANPNSVAYNADLKPTDEPEDWHDGKVRVKRLDQIADLQPESEQPNLEGK